MADTNYYTKPQHQNQANPSKFYSHFLYKALIVSIFLAILPLFPSQAPEFINQTLDTRGWEFLRILFVGIAVSYGLFSRRNDEAEKENNITNNNHSKFDNAELYVSRFLQVSSVFDDEADSPTRYERKKVQTWNHQYFRNEPVVVVAEENSVLDREQRGSSSSLSSSRIGEKPLLLPVRSLKSRVVETNVDETSRVSSGVPGSVSRSSSSSSSGSKRFSRNSSKGQSGQFGGSDYPELEEKVKDNLVLPSPIPWRSRSGRMEVKEEADCPPLYTLPPSMEESECSGSFKDQVSQSPLRKSSSFSSSSPKQLASPKKFSPSLSFSSETQGKIAEDIARKKSFHRSPPPPPPPPPLLPPMIQKSSSAKSNYTAIDDGVFGGKELKRSFTSGGDLNWGANLSMPKSVRTIRSNDSLGEARKEEEFDDGIMGTAEKILKEVEGSSMERTERNTVGFDQSSIKTERQRRESVTFMPQPTYMEFPEEEREEFDGKLVSATESDEDSETEDDEYDIAGASFSSGLAASSKKGEAVSSSVSDGGPDVDKKADEFIAKFREQIRLQRIESIKKSSAQISRNASR